MRDFPIEKSAVGSIDFNEDMADAGLHALSGPHHRAVRQVGDEVQKGQTLFTIDSPDLLQASSTLISAAGVLQLTTTNLARLQDALRDPGDLPEGARAGGLRPAVRRGRATRRPRCGPHFRQDRCRNGPHDRRAQRRPDPRGREPHFGPDHRAQRRPGLFVQPGNAPAPSRSPTSPPCGCSPTSPRADSPRLPGRPGSQGQRDVVSGPDLRGHDHHHLVDRRSRPPAACWCAPRSQIPSTSCAPACSRPS